MLISDKQTRASLEATQAPSRTEAMHVRHACQLPAGGREAATEVNGHSHICHLRLTCFGRLNPTRTAGESAESESDQSIVSD